jgi:hypothetical protein
MAHIPHNFIPHRNYISPFVLKTIMLPYTLCCFKGEIQPRFEAGLKITTNHCFFKFMVEMPLQKLGAAAAPNVFLGKRYSNLSYHNGEAIYVSEAGLYSLTVSSQSLKFAVQRYVAARPRTEGSNFSMLIDISFIKCKNWPLISVSILVVPINEKKMHSVVTMLQHSGK